MRPSYPTNNIDGGGGANTVSYVDSNAGVEVNLRTGVGTGGDAEGDTLTHIRNIIGSLHNDIFGSDANPNNINGNGGTNTISYVDSPAAVNVNLQTGVNTGGDAEGDTLNNINNVIGSNHPDTITSHHNGGTIRSMEGDDTIYTGSGPDIIDGGPGMNTVDYSNTIRGVTVDLDNNLFQRGANGDRLSNITKIIGSPFDDRLVASANGDSILDGAAGRDVLVSSGKPAHFIGGPDSDTYIISSKVIDTTTNTVTIEDYDTHDTNEKIDVSLFTEINQFNNIIINQEGSNVRVTLNPHHNVLLKNTNIADLAESDFILRTSDNQVTVNNEVNVDNGGGWSTLEIALACSEPLTGFLVFAWTKRAWIKKKLGFGKKEENQDKVNNKDLDTSQNQEMKVIEKVVTTTVFPAPTFMPLPTADMTMFIRTSAQQPDDFFNHSTTLIDFGHNEGDIVVDMDLYGNENITQNY